jgi:hypothetical protein
VSANAGVGRAALISARGTSVCARRSITFVNPDAAGVWQIGKSTPPNADAMSGAAALASAMVKSFRASSVSSVAPPSAATAAEASSLCDRVNVAISSSKIRRTINPPNLKFKFTIGVLNFELNQIQIGWSLT